MKTNKIIKIYNLQSMILKDYFFTLWVQIKVLFMKFFIFQNFIGKNYLKKMDSKLLIRKIVHIFIQDIQYLDLNF